MKTSLLSVQILGAGLALLFANACLIVSDDTNDTANDEVGDTTTGDGDGDGDAAEQGGDGDGDNGDGDGDQTGDGDGDGDPDPAVVDACTQACGVFETCEGALPGCLESCIDSHAGLDAQCFAAEFELTQCLASLDCDQLTQFLAQDPIPYPCQAELENSCNGGGGGDCLVGVGIGEGPGLCDVSESCSGMPERSIVCDGVTCTCFVDNVEVGSCSNAAEICVDPGSAAIDACCG